MIEELEMIKDNIYKDLKYVKMACAEEVVDCEECPFCEDKHFCLINAISNTTDFFDE